MRYTVYQILGLALVGIIAGACDNRTVELLSGIESGNDARTNHASDGGAIPLLDSAPWLDDAGRVIYPDGYQYPSDQGFPNSDSYLVRDAIIIIPDGSRPCLNNQQCSSTEYCYSSAGCQSGGGKILGYCQPRPQGCPEIYNPVCGCDRKTYGNECEAHAAGVNIAPMEACTLNQCDHLMYLPSCSTGEVCDFLSCTATSGTCVKKYSSQECDYLSLIAPVCGCDGKTYPHDCYRIAAGVALAHKDACEKGSVVIRTDKESYTNGKQINVKLTNSTASTIYLPGCSVYNLERKENGNWIDYGPLEICVWEGYAMPISPGGSYSKTLKISTNGEYRFKTTYGVNCQPNMPLSTAQCTYFDTAFSNSFLVTTNAKECLDLWYQYRTEMLLAKKCNPVLSSPQCTILVKKSWLAGCDCPTYVNDANTLKKLEQAFEALGCMGIQIPEACKCQGKPSMGRCENSGLCQDIFPD